MVAPSDRQQAIEARFLARSGTPPSPETPMREAWGRPVDWVMRVGRHELMFLPPVAAWFVANPFTGELVPTGFGPGQVVFMEVAGQLGVRRRPGVPPPTVDLDRSWFVRGSAEHEPLPGHALRVRLQCGGLDPRTPVRMAGTVLWRRAGDLLGASAPAARAEPPPEPAPALPEGGFATMAYRFQPFTARLVVEAGPCTGQVFEVDRHGIIGRHPDLQIVLDDQRVSRRHAELECSAEGAWALKDLGGANGTWVNAERVQGQHSVVDGDRLRLGDSTLRVEIGE